MSRVQLALNVADLDAAIAFYSTLFDTEPAKVRPGYANFAVDEPPLKLVLIEGAGEPGTLNHLGVEVFSTAAVAAATTRLAGRGLATASEAGTCCYADQEKVWVRGADGEPWEVYTVLADSDPSVTTLGRVAGVAATTDPDGSDSPVGACCSPATGVSACC